MTSREELTVPTNTAARLGAKHAPLQVVPTEYTHPNADEIVVRSRAVAMNPLEWILQLVGNVIYPWIHYPFVIGSDLAGEVVEVGASVTRFAVGDRVLAHAVGTDKDSNSSARGAFQEYVVVLERLAAPLPAEMRYEDAAVLPLALSTAACGLFQVGQLGLRHPSASPRPSGEAVLVWGGSTSVGTNAIQLAVAAGYEVITTASPKNFDYVTSLGAAQVFDYASPTVVADIVAALAGRMLAGTIALGTGSTGRCIDIAAATTGTKRVAMASTGASFEPVARSRAWLPVILTRIGASAAAQLVKSRMRGVRLSTIWGSSLKNDEVSGMIYADFLPSALADGRYRAAPPALVIGSGLGQVQAALDRQRAGVSAQKLVVSL